MCEIYAHKYGNKKRKNPYLLYHVFTTMHDNPNKKIRTHESALASDNAAMNFKNKTGFSK